jgi:hypothetical protein
VDNKTERLVIPKGTTIKLGGLPFQLNGDTIVIGTKENFEMAMKDDNVKNEIFYLALSELKF